MKQSNPRKRKALVHVIIALALFALVSRSFSQPEPPISGNWTLTLDENFNGTELDATIWRSGQHYGAPHDFMYQAFRPENITVSGGYLTLHAEKATGTQFGVQKNYRSGEISTWKKWRQLYGYFEARIKYDVQKGLWPAFWTMPDRGGPYGDETLWRRVFVKFDMTGDSRNSVTTAELKLTVSYVGPGGHVHLYACKDNWSEDTVTWSNQPEMVGVWIGEKNNLTSTGTISFSNAKLTEYINTQLAGDKVISFCLVDGYQRNVAVNFHTSENATAANRPQLVLSGTPSVVYAGEDSYVRAGADANTNYNSVNILQVREPYDYSITATTGNGMEIDIMEALGIWGLEQTQHAVHWDGYEADHKYKSWDLMKFPATSDGFHTYGMCWEPGKITYYIDGKKTMTWESPEVCSVPAFLILSYQIGSWESSNVPNASTFAPSDMVVDYVRVWSGTPDAETAPDDVLTPTDDAHIRGGEHAATNFGGGDYLNATVGSNPTNETYIWDSYLKFNVSGLSGIRKAVLELTNYLNADEDTITAWETSDSWNEGTLNWNNAPAPGAIIFSGVAFTDGGTTTIDVTDYIKEQASGDGTASLTIFRLLANDKINFYSKESGFAPKLKIWYEPGGGLPAVADSFVRDGAYAAVNYGSEESLVAKQAGVDFMRWSYIKFNLAGQSAVQNAYLNIVVTSSASTSLKIWSSSSSWSETGITWNNKPGKGTSLGTLNVSGPGVYVKDVTSLVNANLGGTVTFLVEGTDSAFVTMGSKESANPPLLDLIP